MVIYVIKMIICSILTGKFKVMPVFFLVGEEFTITNCVSFHFRKCSDLDGVVSSLYLTNKIIIYRNRNKTLTNLTDRHQVKFQGK